MLSTFLQWFTSRRTIVAVLCLALGLGGPWSVSPASAQSLSLFRDAEIEDTIRVYAVPLFEAANLNPESIEIHLVDDNVLNAFVANGRHLFLFSGLLMESRDPNLVIGVIAHETGHLSGGHLARVRGAYENASAMVLLSTILGVAVGVLGGGAAGVAIMASGSQIGQRQFLTYARTQESAADQAGLRFLEATGQSAEGLRDMMATLSENELLLTNPEIPYFLTHPLSTERVRAIDAHIERSAYADAVSPPDLVDRQRRMVAKLFGFLEPPRTTYLHYPNRDADLYSRYAWAIAKYQERLMDEALELIDGLLAEEPENPYFHELRGQMLYDTGSVVEAIPSYERAVALAPDQPLLHIGLAQALLQFDDPASWELAVEELTVARRYEEDSPRTWHLLGQAYGKLEMEPQSHVARAEMHFLRGEMDRARDFAGRAIQGLDYGTPEWFRADDIIAAAGNAGGG
ncbi:MAG: M48 family metalloprotease [Rhodospirillaceae bacterium]|nr:M48 family metalloprotease [Rhodospirillaceae bacterium]MBT6512093.1 M48 family metalloprotease [Rhodospirillaceae bacterium]